MIKTVSVVVPAHDEEETLPGCLAALHAAAARVAPIPVHLLVVADACGDRTASLAQEGGAEVIRIQARRVGVARGTGFTAALRRNRTSGLGQVWLATTDADTVVPSDWLTRQLGHARQGWDVVVGTVEVTDWTGHPPQVPGRFTARYAHGPGPHPHVHGANLGMTATAYQASGGFPRLRTGEDHALVEALEAAGQKILRSADVTVVTSARRRGRAPGGFSDLLAALG